MERSEGKRLFGGSRFLIVGGFLRFTMATQGRSHRGFLSCMGMTEGLQPSLVGKDGDGILEKAATSCSRSAWQARTTGGSAWVPPFRAGTGAFAFLTGSKGRILSQVARTDTNPREVSPGMRAAVDSLC